MDTLVQLCDVFSMVASGATSASSGAAAPNYAGPIGSASASGSGSGSGNGNWSNERRVIANAALALARVAMCAPSPGLSVRQLL